MADPIRSQPVDLVQRETADLLTTAVPILARLADLSADPANRLAMSCGVVDWLHGTPGLRADVARLLMEGIESAAPGQPGDPGPDVWLCLTPAPSWLGGPLAGALGWRSFRSNRRDRRPSPG